MVIRVYRKNAGARGHAFICSISGRGLSHSLASRFSASECSILGKRDKEQSGRGELVPKRALNAKKDA